MHGFILGGLIWSLVVLLFGFLTSEETDKVMWAIGSVFGGVIIILGGVLSYFIA